LEGEKEDDSSDDVLLQKAKPKIYFNFDIDTLYISAASMGNETIRARMMTLIPLQPCTPRIKHVAIDPVIPGPFPNLRPQTVLSSYYRQIIRSYPQLETLTIVRDWSTWNSVDKVGLWESQRQKYSPRDIFGLTLPELCAFEYKVLNYLERKRRRVMRKPRNSLYPTPQILHKAYFGTGDFVEPSCNLLRIYRGGEIFWETDGSGTFPLVGAEIALIDKDVDRMIGDLHEADFNYRIGRREIELERRGVGAE